MTLNKGFNISGTTAVKAPKLFMILRLDRKNSFPKFGILPIARSTNWKLFQKVLKWLYFERLRSYMTETYTTFTLLSLLPWWTVSFLFLAIMVKNISWLQWNKKNIFTSSKLQKTSILWLQIIWGLDIPGSKFGVLEIPTLSLLEKRRKTWRSLNKSMKDNSTNSNLEQVI